jgi:ribokinase
VKNYKSIKDKLIYKTLDKSMNNSIIVVGSTNTDMVVRADHIPAPGETLLGGAFFMNPGGKGANQAVAAVRLGGNVTFICKTGADVFGRGAIQLFKDEGINTSFVISDTQNPSGVALITVSKDAENSIVVAPGANAALNTAEIKGALNIINRAAIVLIQLEIPLDVVAEVVSAAHKNNVKVVLNPAPACKLPDDVLKCIDIITPNETEASILTGIDVCDMATAKQAAKVLHEKGIQTVIITLGSKGALIFYENKYDVVDALKVEAKDTTAAGDVFNGALVVALTEGKNIYDSVAFACKASAISVTRLGAQSSAPYRNEIN